MAKDLKDSKSSYLNKTRRIKIKYPLDANNPTYDGKYHDVDVLHLYRVDSKLFVLDYIDNGMQCFTLLERISDRLWEKIPLKDYDGFFSAFELYMNPNYEVDISILPNIIGCSGVKYLNDVLYGDHAGKGKPSQPTTFAQMNVIVYRDVTTGDYYEDEELTRLIGSWRNVLEKYPEPYYRITVKDVYHLEYITVYFNHSTGRYYEDANCTHLIGRWVDVLKKYPSNKYIVTVRDILDYYNSPPSNNNNNNGISKDGIDIDDKNGNMNDHHLYVTVYLRDNLYYDDIDCNSLIGKWEDVLNKYPYPKYIIHVEAVRFKPITVTIYYSNDLYYDDIDGNSLIGKREDVLKKYPFSRFSIDFQKIREQLIDIYYNTDDFLYYQDEDCTQIIGSEADLMRKYPTGKFSLNIRIISKNRNRNDSHESDKKNVRRRKYIYYNKYDGRYYYDYDCKEELPISIEEYRNMYDGVRVLYIDEKTKNSIKTGGKPKKRKYI